MEDIFMGKLVHAQTVIDEKDLLKLKVKTKETTTKNALEKAIFFFLKNN